MSNTSGNSGTVKIGAATVAEVLDFTISQGAVTIDNSSLGDAEDTHLVGSTNWSASINGFYDESDATGQELMKSGDTVTVILNPVAGATFTGSGTVESHEIGLSRNGMVSVSFTVKGNGALAET